MTIWLRIETSPALQIGGGSDTLTARDDATVTTGSIDLGSSDGNASADFSIIGASSATRRALLIGAVGAAVTVYRGATAIYSGTVDGHRVGVTSRAVVLRVQS